MQTSAEELPVHRDARQWKKFGACANATGPERGITIVCDRRPVEFSWSDISTRRFAAEISYQMKHEWAIYTTKQVLPKLRAPAPTATSAVPGPQSAPKTTVNQGGSRSGTSFPTESVAARSKQHSQVGESTSPLAPTAAPDSRHAPEPRDDSVLKMQPVGNSMAQRKLGGFASQSTLHTEAPEFIPKGFNNPPRTTQPVQLLNNDVHQDPGRGFDDRSFGLPDPQHRSAPNGNSDHKGQFGFSADGPNNFFNESREMNGNAMNGDDDESARRNQQLLNMKAKLKGHYRLLYSKYKEYVQKRVPEKVEEYYIRLKHCQAQYMKLKYYEYKAHAQAPNPRNNQMKGPGPSDPHPSHSSPQRPGPGSRGGVVPQNNPWTSGGGKGGFDDGYNYGSNGGGGGGGGGSWDQRGFNPREQGNPDFGDESWGGGSGGSGGWDRGRGGGQNGSGGGFGFGGGQSLWENNPSTSFNRAGRGGANRRGGSERPPMNGGGNGYGGGYGRQGPGDHMGGGYGSRHNGQSRF